MTAQALIADKAYDTDERVIKVLAATGRTTVIPPKANRKHPRKYDEALYEVRHLIQNFFCWVKQFRALATCYDKTSKNSLAACHLLGAMHWLN